MPLTARELARSLATVLDGQLGVHGCPGTITLFGDRDVVAPVVCDRKSEAVVAVAVHGLGTVVAVAHEGYVNELGKHAPGNANLTENADKLFRGIGGLSQQESSGLSHVYVLGKPQAWCTTVQQHCQHDVAVTSCANVSDIADLLNPKGPSAPGTAATEETSTHALIVWMGKHASGTVVKDSEEASAMVTSLLDLVEQGHSLIVCMCPWGFEQITKLTVRDNAAQQYLLLACGMAFTSSYSDGPFSVCNDDTESSSIARSGHDGIAAPDLVSSLAITTTQGTDSAACALVNTDQILHAIDVLPSQLALGGQLSTPLEPSVSRFVDFVRADLSLAALHSLAFDSEQAVEATKNPSQWLSIQLHSRKVAHVLDQLQFSDTIPLTSEERDLLSHLPCASSFPGDISPQDSKDVKAGQGDVELTSFPVTCMHEGYDAVHTTGIYLRPGQPIKMSLRPPEAAGSWELQIGCHSDKLVGKQQLKRWPTISHVVAVSEKATEMLHPWGGLLYLKPKGCSQPLPDTSVELVVSGPGAVEAPVFRHEDTLEQWQRALKTCPAPWGELQGKHLIMTLPRDALQRIADPRPVVDFWDSVVQSHSALISTSVPARRQRIVCDVQISAGYMHAGYPIMTHMDVAHVPDDKAPPIWDVEGLRKMGSWGLFHEIGHNFQDSRWTFEGTGEVTCNWFTLHAMQSLVGFEAWSHPWLERQKAKALAFVKDGGEVFKTWQQDPGIGLVTFALLIHWFGWDWLRRVLAEYATDSVDVSRNSPRDDKIHKLVLTMSRQSGHNLVPYFQQWHFPPSALPTVESEGLPPESRSVVEALS